MIPVDQDRFFDPDKGTRGNCQQAAVASLLEFPLRAVPNFMDHESFWGAFHRWLALLKFEAVHINPEHPPGPDVYWLAYGPAARGIRHAVVYKGSELAHDPHPSRAGLISVDDGHLIRPKEDL